MVFIVSGNSTLLEASVMHVQVWTCTKKLHSAIYTLMRCLRSLYADQVPAHKPTNLHGCHKSQVSNKTCYYFIRA